MAGKKQRDVAVVVVLAAVLHIALCCAATMARTRTHDGLHMSCIHCRKDGRKGMRTTDDRRAFVPIHEYCAAAAEKYSNDSRSLMTPMLPAPAGDCGSA